MLRNYNDDFGTVEGEHTASEDYGDLTGATSAEDYGPLYL